MAYKPSLAWPDPTRKEGSGPMPNMDLYRAAHRQLTKYLPTATVFDCSFHTSGVQGGKLFRAVPIITTGTYHTPNYLWGVDIYKCMLGIGPDPSFLVGSGHTRLIQTMENSRICHCRCFMSMVSKNFVQPFLRSRELLRYTHAWTKLHKLSQAESLALMMSLFMALT